MRSLEASDHPPLSWIPQGVLHPHGHFGELSALELGATETDTMSYGRILRSKDSFLGTRTALFGVAMSAAYDSPEDKA